MNVRELPQVYPQRVVQLPAGSLMLLLNTLRAGIGMAGDVEVTQSVFEALAALARHCMRTGEH